MSKVNGTVVSTPLAQVTTPLLALALPQGGTVPPSLVELDRAVGGVVGGAITSGDFKGKRDESALLYPGDGKAERVLLVGLGKPGEVTRSSIRRAAAVAAKRARSLGAGAQHFAFAVAREARNGVAGKDLGPVGGHGGAAGRGAGDGTGAPLHRTGVSRRGRRGPSHRPRGEGRHVRLGRDLDQAGAEHGGHEVRHVGGRRGARHVRGARGPQAEAQRGGPHSRNREPAVRHRREAGRRGEEPFRQDDRDHQHRCGRAPDPVRRAVVRAALQAGRRAGHRHAHGRGGRGPGPGGDRGHGERRGTRERSARSGRARRRALLAAAPVGRVPRAAQVRHRRRQELRRPGRRHDRGGLVPARVRGRLPLGAPRHRGHGLHRRRGPPPGQGPDGSRGPALHRIHSQARGRVTRGLRGAAVLLAPVGAGGGGAAPAAAQVDTTARDTTARKDTTARDTTPAYPPVFAEPTPAGPLPRGTRYRFTADSFALSNIQTLSDLLDHIPGVYVARGGFYGQAEIVFYGARGAAGLEIYWDGVPYLPIGRDSVF